MKVDVVKKVAGKIAKFPFLGITKTGCVVLFAKPKSGICLEVGDTPNTVGYYSPNWLEHEFEPFEGSITISND